MDFLSSINVADYFVHFLIGTSAYSAEMQSFWMAIQGSVAVRDGPNKDSHMQWFHSFVYSVIFGYGGGLLGFIWMGKPSSMLSNDLNVASCILAWIFINCMPFDIGYKICKTIPVVLVTTSFAQLFRSVGIIRFVNTCFNEFKLTPSSYYPIPVFGPILYATVRRIS
jgi:TRIC channel